MASELYLVTSLSLREVMLMGQAAPCSPTATSASTMVVTVL